MKFKYLSMALAAVALASCSSDDLQLADGTTMTLADDGSQVFATIVEPEDLVGGTRAGFATQINYNEDGSQKSISQTAMFQTGDEFKLYCTHTWKPQVYKFVQDAEIDGVNGSLFEFKDGESPYNDAGELSTREYGVFPADNFSFKDERRSKLYFNLPATNAYQVNEGYYSSQKTSLVTSSGTDLSSRKVYSALVPLFGFNKDNKVSFNYMTSLIRVQLQGVGPGSHVVRLTQATGSKKLSGELESSEFVATDGNKEGAKLPVFNTTTAANDAEKAVSVTFPTDGTESDYIIYLPMPTGEYALSDLRLELVNNADPAINLPFTIASGTYKGFGFANGVQTNPTGATAAQISAFTTAAADFELATGTRLLAKYEGIEKRSVSNLLELNSLLKMYADFGRDANVEITLNNDISIPAAGDGTTVEQNKKLILPTLKNNVTFNIKGGHDITTNPLVIQDASTTVGTGKFTLHLDASTENISCTAVNSTSAQNIELMTTDGTGKTAKFAGATFNNAAAKVGLNATFTAIPTVTAASEITIGKDLGVAIDAGTANLIIKDKMTGAVTVNGGNVTIDAEAADVVPTVIVKKAATTKLEGADVLIKGGTVTALTLGDPSAATAAGITAKVKMEGGKIGTLQGTGTSGVFADGTALTVETAGAAEIATVKDLADATKSSISFSSTWNDATSASAATAQANIYTAAQLKAAAGVALPVMQTDVTIATTTTAGAFASIVLDGTTTTFDGNGHTISGLTAPLFGAFANAVTIKGLKLAAVNITSTDEANGVGALAPSVAAAVTVENSSVAGSISGHYFVGGLVGKVTGGSLTIGYQATSAAETEQTKMTAAKVTSDVVFTNTKTYGSAIGWDMNAATWGQFVGTVTGTGVLTIAENCTGNTKFDKSALKFSYNRTNNGSGTITGYYKGNTDLVGYTTTTGNIQYGNKTYKAGWATPVLTVTGDATLQTIGEATILTTEPYKELDDATKTAIKTAQSGVLTNAIDKINWSNLTIVSHNTYVAAPY